jgi:VanZ family protein
VKGDVIKDPSKVLERLQKKFSKNVELISPKPMPENKQKKEPEKKEQVKFYIFFSIHFFLILLLSCFFFTKYYSHLVKFIYFCLLIIVCRQK